MNPSIGRIVHYHSYGKPDGKFLPEPRAAIVAGVEADGTTCQIVVFDPTNIYSVNTVPFSEDPKPGHWNWPPRI